MIVPNKLVGTILCVAILLFAVAEEEKSCPGFQLRNDPSKNKRQKLASFRLFANCTVIRGDVHLLYSGSANSTAHEDYWYYSLRHVREITGALFIFNVFGLKSIRHMFPELRVIRGQTLIHNYALVLYQNNDLTEVGLPNLVEISRGGVRITKNPEMCFANAVDWGAILRDKTAQVYIHRNKEDELCPAPSECVPGGKDKTGRCHFDIGSASQPDALSYYCWSRTECQKVCPQGCSKQNLSCNLDSPSAHCCHHQCAGGCRGPTDRDCVACRNLSFDNRCVPSCPQGYYELRGRGSGCMSKSDCLMLPSEEDEFGEIKYFKTFDRYCILICPEGMEDDNETKTCKKCQGGCTITCRGLQVRSIAEAENLKDCNILKGNLEITFRSNLDSSRVSETLATSLGKIVEVSGFVKVASSPSIQNLNFLSNLRVIGGEKLFNDKYSLAILDNEVLSDLWNASKGNSKPSLHLERGNIQAHNNPSLCYEKIREFIKAVGHGEKADDDLGKVSNGNNAFCDDLKLSLEFIAYQDNVAFTWTKLNSSAFDTNSFLGYQLFYKKVKSHGNVSILGDRISCHDSWFDVLIPPQSNAYNLTGLQPASLYACYLRTNVIHSNKSVSGVSDVKFFNTLYDYPSPVRKVVAWPIASHSINITFQPPSFPNGQITYYRLQWTPIPPLQFSDQCYFCQTTRMNIYELRYQQKIAALRKPVVELNGLPRHCMSKQTDQSCCSCNKGNTTGTEGDDFPKHVSYLAERARWGSAAETMTNGFHSVVANVEEEASFENYVLNFVLIKDFTSKFARYIPSGLIHEKGKGLTGIPSSQHGGNLYTRSPISDKRNTIDLGNDVDRFGQHYPHGILANSSPVLLTGTHPGHSGIYPMQARAGDIESDGGFYQLSNESAVDSGVFVVESESVPVVVVDDGSEDEILDPGGFRTRAVNVTKTHFVITNLSHFHQYEIKIWACQNISAPSHFCSRFDARKLVLTGANPEKDRIEESSVRLRRINNSFAKSKFEGNTWNISWRPPASPNGRILHYLIRIEKIAEERYHFEICVRRDRTRLQHQLETEGNYSVKVAAVTDYSLPLATYPWTQARFIIVKLHRSPSKLPYIVVPLSILLVVVSCASLMVWKLRTVGDDAIGGTNPDYIPYIADEWELSRKTIELGTYISSGTFGKVVHGLGRDITSACGVNFGPCAVKMLKRTLYNVEDKNAFLHEAQIWKSYCKSPHIVSLLGVVSDGQPALIVMEFMELGNLRDFLIEKRNNPSSGKIPDYQDILLMACQIADGMAYLERKQFVHRDLAARNCLLAADWTCKIGDFGMARELALGEQYYRTRGKRMMPVRWMSPEALQSARFNNKSDVWAYGVVLWEMATFGKQPYYGISELKDVIGFITKGQTMKIPTDCPDLLAKTMNMCWQMDSSMRPCFYDILPIVVSGLSRDAAKQFLNKSYFGNPVEVMKPHDLEVYPMPFSSQKITLSPSESENRLYSNSVSTKPKFSISVEPMDDPNFVRQAAASNRVCAPYENLGKHFATGVDVDADADPVACSRGSLPNPNLEPSAGLSSAAADSETGKLPGKCNLYHPACRNKKHRSQFLKYFNSKMKKTNEANVADSLQLLDGYSDKTPIDIRGQFTFLDTPHSDDIVFLEVKDYKFSKRKASLASLIGVTDAEDQHSLLPSDTSDLGDSSCVDPVDPASSKTTMRFDAAQLVNPVIEIPPLICSGLIESLENPSSTPPYNAVNYARYLNDHNINIASTQPGPIVNLDTSYLPCSITKNQNSTNRVSPNQVSYRKPRTNFMPNVNNSELCQKENHPPSSPSCSDSSPGAIIVHPNDPHPTFVGHSDSQSLSISSAVLPQNTQKFTPIENSTDPHSSANVCLAAHRRDCATLPVSTLTGVLCNNEIFQNNAIINNGILQKNHFGIGECVKKQCFHNLAEIDPIVIADWNVDNCCDAACDGRNADGSIVAVSDETSSSIPTTHRHNQEPIASSITKCLTAPPALPLSCAVTPVLSPPKFASNGFLAHPKCSTSTIANDLFCSPTAAFTRDCASAVMSNQGMCTESQNLATDTKVSYTFVEPQATVLFAGYNGNS